MIRVTFFLDNGSVGFTEYQNTLNIGSVTLTASYSGDITYLAATQSINITVTQSAFSLAATPPPAISPGSSATSTVTASTSTDYSGFVSLTCALTSGQSNQTGNAPTCAVVNSTVQLEAGGAQSGSAEVNVNTTAATAKLARPDLPGSGNRWRGAGGIALALLVLLGIPARRRSWRAMLGVLVLLALFGGLSACGGGGSAGGGSGGGGGGNPGTTAGTYTFTVTGTGNPAVTPTPTTTFTLTVN